MSNPSQLQSVLDLRPPQKPPGPSTTGSRRHVTTACTLCRALKQKCDGQSPCQPCQSKGLACAYDSASDVGDRRKLRASASEYNTLLQYKAILDNLCHAIQLGTADKALQRIREGASPLDLADLLNNAARGPFSNPVDFTVTHPRPDLSTGGVEQNPPPDSQVYPMTNQWYPSNWYNDPSRMVASGSTPGADTMSATSSFYQGPDNSGAQHLAAQQQVASQQQTQNPWLSSLAPFGLQGDYNEMLIGHSAESETLETTSDFLQQPPDPESDRRREPR